MTLSPGQLHEDERALLALVPGVPASARVDRPTPGQDNLIAVVDERWVVRIARTDEARVAYANEVAILGALVGHRVPQVEVAHGHGMVYEYIEGTRLTPHIWNARSDTERRSIAGDIHAALRALHALPVEILPSAADRLDRAWVLESIERCAALPPRAPLGFDPMQLADRFTAAWSDTTDPCAIVHIDLKPDNLVHQSGRASIIDFGACCLADPAIDYGVLTHHFGESVLDAMGLSDTPLAARARCYGDLYHLRRCTRGWTRSAPAPASPS